MDLRTARKRVGMSQEALAKKIGVSQPIIHHIETGQTFPSVFQQMQIEKALNVSIDWEDHINAPLTGREKLMLNRLYEIGIQKMDEQECADFLARQDNATLRKLFRLAGLSNGEEPLTSVEELRENQEQRFRRRRK